MKISIFPNCKPHPIKEEKTTEALKFSYPNLPEPIEIDNDDALIKYITNYAWSPAIFDGYRKAENFVSCDFLVYDIDKNLTIDKADEILQNTNYCYLILPSPSHTPQLHRFRIVIPLSHSILDLATFEATWETGAKLFNGAVDPQCSDSCRAYFASTQEDGFCDFTRDFFTPVKKEPVKLENKGYRPSQTLMIDVNADTKDIIKAIYGKDRDRVPEAVDFFIRNAQTGIHGGWVCALNSFCFSLSLSNVADDVIMELVEKLAPEPLDKRDLAQITRAIKDGKKERL